MTKPFIKKPLKPLRSMLTLTTLDLCRLCQLLWPFQRWEEPRMSAAVVLGTSCHTGAVISNWEQSYDLQSLRYFSNSYPSYSSLSLFVCTNTEYHRCLYHIRTWTWSLFASRQVHLCLEHRDQPLKALKEISFKFWQRNPQLLQATH